MRLENVDVEDEDIIGTLKKGIYVKMTFSDQGTGIAEEHIQKVFSPYFSTKSGGSGLGLATTYSIIKKHDGYIGVDSELGVGTRFSIYLRQPNRKSLLLRSGKSV